MTWSVASELVDAIAGSTSTGTTTRRGPTCSAGSDAPTRRGSLYVRALALTEDGPEKRFLERRRRETTAGTPE